MVRASRCRAKCEEEGVLIQRLRMNRRQGGGLRCVFNSPRDLAIALPGRPWRSLAGWVTGP